MKPLKTGNERAIYVQKMFAVIARRYDFMNRLMTGGQDKRWRNIAVNRLGLTSGGMYLDTGSGTGDLAHEILLQNDQARVYAADFTLPMMLVGKRRYGLLPFLAADGLHLPFQAGTFDGAISGFYLRNVGDLDAAVGELYRVLKPGGRIVILETTKPGRNLFSPFIWIHMHMIIPLLGWILSGAREAYQYLPNSSEQFLSAEDLAKRLKLHHFTEIGFQRLMLGTIAIHWASKS